MPVFVLFAIVIAFTVASIAFVTWNSRRRSRALAATAEALGLNYRRNGADLLNEGLFELPLFAFAALGHRGTLSNVIRGDIAGTFVTACDYAYWTGSLNNQRFDYAQTVVCFRLTPNRYPTFALYPAGDRLRQAPMAAARRSAEILTAIAKPFSSNDGRWTALERALRAEPGDEVEFETSPDFARRYQIVGSEEDRIRQLLRRDVIDGLLNSECYPLSIECSGVWLAMYQKNRRVAPRDFQAFLERCVTLKDALIAH
jgi:hypothetical protein